MVKKQKKDFSGVGQTSLKVLYSRIGVNPFQKALRVKTSQRIVISKLKNRISYSRALKIKLKESVEFLISLKNYRGVRHFLSYPVRGQRTHTNAKTRKKQKKISILPKSIKKKPYVQKK